jgi:hypothetical protein
MSELSTSDEMRLFKVLEHHANDGRVQDLAVCRPYGFRDFRDSLTFNVKIPNISKSNVSVGLHSNGLIELSHKGEEQVKYVTSAQMVPGIALK